MRRRALAAVTALAVVVTAGCGGTGTARDGADPGPPTGADALVLRWTELPGLLPPGGAAAIPPAYALYGDARLITGRPAAPGTGVWPVFEERRIAASELPGILRRAADAKLLGGASAAGPRPPGPDAPMVRITVASAGARQTTMLPRTDGSLAALRGDLSRLAAGAGTPYRPATVAVIATANDDPSAPTRAWPLPALDGEPMTGLNAGATCTLLRGDEIETARRAAGDATPGTLWRSGDRSWSIALRPLLPDETGCGAL
jgi:hypothetical protein